jgi:hypothetical protein
MQPDIQRTNLILLCLLIVYVHSQTITEIQYDTQGYLSSFLVTVPTPMTDFSPRQIYFYNTNTSKTYTALGATWSQISTSSWRLYSPKGFVPEVGLYHVSFRNDPPQLCTPPVSPAIITRPTTVVGTGDASSCTESVLLSAIQAGGAITFNCGSSPVVITISTPKTFTKDTIIDGGGLVTLQGQNSRIFQVLSPYNVNTPNITLQGLIFKNGYTTDVVNTTSTSTGGGAIYRSGGILNVFGCEFYDNQGPITGQDVAGGAIFSTGGSLTTVVNSIFGRNKASNGGAIGNLGNSFSIYNSVFFKNTATGLDGNPGHGGNGGSISFDGKGVNTIICGVQFLDSTANVCGGTIFRVGYTLADSINVDASTFLRTTSATGGIYLQGLTISIKRSTIAFGKGSSGVGIFFGPSGQLSLDTVTIANNTNLVPASSGTTAGIFFGSNSGSIGSSTIVNNIANYAPGIGFASGGSTTLSNSIVANNAAGNVYTAMNCINSLGEGGNNFQWPIKKPPPSNSQDTSLCSTGINQQDPKMGQIGDHGCTTLTVPSNVNSGADANCGTRVMGQSTYSFDLSGNPIPRSYGSSFTQININIARSSGSTIKISAFAFVCILLMIVL